MNRAFPAVIAACLMATPTLAEEPSFSTGGASVLTDSLVDCGSRSRVSPVGEVTSEDGLIWTVPAQTAFANAPLAADLYNECGGTKLASLSELDLSSVPLMDAGGSEEFAAYIFGDNYFELSVNGALLAVDAVPFTPFNSNIIRFSADRPVSLAVKMVDWEENLGLGSEPGRGSQYNPGDGGLVMVIKDASGDTVAITDSNWKAQTFYTGPLKDRTCLLVDQQVRDSSDCDTKGVNSGEGLSMAHWAIPEDWSDPSFDDSDWPQATEFSNDTVGVNNKKAYTNFSSIWDNPAQDARFIWSRNLVLDNLVLLRGGFE